ncbi:MAG: hypothetical protein WA813_09200, partial [Beijerinckiaceae bacterium]
MHHYNGARTHLSLGKDTPVQRAVQVVGRILPTPILVDRTIGTFGFNFRQGGQASLILRAAVARAF